MRNLSLHDALATFTSDAGVRLKLAAEGGDEIPFEVIESDDRSGRGRIPLYCYRPLTGEFIRARLGLLVALPSYAPAARALEAAGGGEVYLRSRGEPEAPPEQRGLADTTLRAFLARVFRERSEFDFDEARFEQAYEELERALYQGRCVTQVVAPLLGIDLDPGTDELVIGDGLSLVRPGALAQPPADLRTDGAQPPLLAVLRIAHDRQVQPSVAFARTRFRRLLTALRLYERGSYAIAPLGYSRIDDGVWTPAPLGHGARPRRLTLIPAAGEDELRGFCNLIARRLPGRAGGASSGEVAWALSRFEMAAERTSPLEALSDHLLALRALLEPEGPTSGRLAQRLAVICAPAHERAALVERTVAAIALERDVISGIVPIDEPDAECDAMVDELAEHLRAILRDVLCGHLNGDVCGVADDLLADAAEEAAAV